MAGTTYNYTPTYIKRTIANKPKDVVTATYWNELFNLLITQGDHTAEELGNILNHLSTEIEGLADDVVYAVNEEREYASAFEIRLFTNVDPVTADKSFAEIRQAIIDKREILLWVSDIQCLKPVCRVFEHVLTLTAFDNGIQGHGLCAYLYECYEDNSWSIDKDIELASITDTGLLSNLTTTHKANLVAAVNEVKHTADGKQDTINDLEAIRTGAAKGATALQSVPSSYRTAAAQDVIDSGLSDRVSAIEGKEAGWNGKYSKPTDGIPKTDLESAVQTSLGKAETALQSVPSTYRTASEQDTIDSGKVDKVTGKGLSTNDYTDADKAKVDAIEPVTEQTVSGWGFTKNTGTYSKPTGGIPKADLASDVQASLGKAETALQEHQSLAAYRTSADQDVIDGSKQDKLIAGENITIAADGKTISATGGGGGSVQSDWNQNDSTAADYVKNRPFYTGNPVETALVEENTVPFEYNEVVGGLYIGTLPQEFSVIVGETYKVYWDNTAYECACGDVDGDIVLGNLSISGLGSDTGEPFLVVVSIGERTIISTTDTSASHTISIRGLVPGIVKIDAKYLPFDVPTKTSQLENDAGYLTLATLPKYEGVVV